MVFKASGVLPHHPARSFGGETGINISGNRRTAVAIRP
jgi:hypothetical protein